MNMRKIMLAAVAVATLSTSAWAGSSYSGGFGGYGGYTHQNGGKKYGFKQTYNVGHKKHKNNNQNFNFNFGHNNKNSHFNFGKFDFGKSHKTSRFKRDCDLGGWQNKFCKFDDWKKDWRQCQRPKMPWDCDAPPWNKRPKECDPDVTDGTVVPVPAAGWAGMTLLGGLAAVGKLRRRRSRAAA